MNAAFKLSTEMLKRECLKLASSSHQAVCICCVCAARLSVQHCSLEWIHLNQISVAVCVFRIKCEPVFLLDKRKCNLYCFCHSCGFHKCNLHLLAYRHQSLSQAAGKKKQRMLVFKLFKSWTPAAVTSLLDFILMDLFFVCLVTVSVHARVKYLAIYLRMLLPIM